MGGLANLGINGAELLAQVVNFFVLFGLLFLVAYKPLMRILDERTRKVRESIEQTEYIKQRAAGAEEEVRKRIEAAGQEGQSIIARAVRTGEDVRQQAQQEAKKDAEALLNRAKAEIQHERDEAVSELRREFADLTVTAAEKVINRSLDKKAHRELIEETLEESTLLK